LVYFSYIAKICGSTFVVSPIVLAGVAQDFYTSKKKKLMTAKYIQHCRDFMDCNQELQKNVIPITVQRVQIPKQRRREPVA
jgi:hypothetical protein